VHIGRNKEPRKVLEWNEFRSVKWHAARAKLAFDEIGLRARGMAITRLRGCRLTSVEPLTLAAPRRHFVHCASLGC
jgi:hypothetical protein